MVAFINNLPFSEKNMGEKVEGQEYKYPISKKIPYHGGTRSSLGVGAETPTIDI